MHLADPDVEESDQSRTASCFSLYNFLNVNVKINFSTAKDSLISYLKTCLHRIHIKNYSGKLIRIYEEVSKVPDFGHCSLLIFNIVIILLR